jgi:tetratricopeptide (TPR) repeat protein
MVQPGPTHSATIAIELLRSRQFVEAAAAFRGALEFAPRDARLLFGYGEALAGQGRDVEAIAAYRAAIEARPGYQEAWYQVGSALHRSGELEAAEAAYRSLLALSPDYLPAKLALGGLLIDAMRPVEAEGMLAGCLNQPGPPRLQAMMHANYGLALRRQRKDEHALESYEHAARFDSALPGLEIHRAEALQNLERYEEALAMYRMALARDPLDAEAHRHYNDLLYRLDRMEDYLKSYERAPKTPALMTGKAYFLMQQRRYEEAYDVYRDFLAKWPDEKVAAAGAARALLKMKRYDEAAGAYSALMAQHGGDAAVCGRTAEFHLVHGDAEQALVICERGLRTAPYDQSCLAALSVSLRMLEDERDEELSNYGELIQVFDLEPPEGFSSMETFNGELDTYLDRFHPETREYIGQSLRGGTQTPDHIFHAGHDLIDRLERRIADAIARYVAGLEENNCHPFVARRAGGFRYAGSWSSRLKDSGFHINHIHPQGWISSCYYVAVPRAAGDKVHRQGWIKFGEPDFDVGLNNAVRRSVQPVPGRLVLFPSYMWHGTVPFRDTQRRTTIAFDALPRN